jgi:hypothetical protein
MLDGGWTVQDAARFSDATGFRASVLVRQPARDLLAIRRSSSEFIGVPWRFARRRNVRQISA